MTDEVQKQLLSRLDALAGKLGVAAQYIYALYVKQAKIDGYEYAVAAGVFAIIGIIGVFLARKFWTAARNSSTRSYYNEAETEAVFTTIATVAAFVGAVLLAINSFDLVQNPQYWAFHSILDQIK